jgi:hypothetical protein
MPIVPSFFLTAHPDFDNPAVRAIGGRIARTGGVLTATWTLEGDLDRLRVPAWKGRLIGERLWEHTCFEIFIRADGTGPARTSAYRELNFAPSGAWAAFAFEDYRKAAAPAHAYVDPEIAVRRGDSAFELEASVRLEHLSKTFLQTPLVLGVSAVIEVCDGGLSYWALAHPAGKPDFHHPEAFQLVISPSARSPE